MWSMSCPDCIFITTDMEFLFTVYTYCHIFQHNTIESVLQRGEKLDDLVDKSDALGMQSKTFYKTVSQEKKRTTKLINTSLFFYFLQFSRYFFIPPFPCNLHALDPQCCSMAQWNHFWNEERRLMTSWGNHKI